ncbi:MAG: GNAT family N-acetyltransferase [Actinobacteria bacterium]|nr:GNAT family N-acetyltransferase [Actinomycetota bacterium]MCO5299358.1 GNAT family N-acetyltransferase [Candidatus Nanopelagicales bacterium]MCB9427964.1 GNAT family N-acetyltransferase [Actinomycetota bacterium]HPE13559.1 GNAT family protein [Actinomycetota bacterium]HPJ18984.1 GNAT family protein [Actinomycetota bacterium]
MRPIEPVVLQGRWVRLEPLAADHSEPLRAIDDPALFTYLPDVPDDFDGWLPTALASRDPLFYAAVVDGRTLGRASFLRMDYPNGVAEIGHILWGHEMRRTPASTEAVYLMTEHLFGLGARRVEWKCDNLNEASKAAALRFGFTFEGVFRQHKLVKGRNRDTAWFSLLDHEWPARRAALSDWLDPGNFDVDGQQRRRLERPTTA